MSRPTTRRRFGFDVPPGLVTDLVEDVAHQAGDAQGNRLGDSGQGASQRAVGPEHHDGRKPPSSSIGAGGPTRESQPLRRAEAR